VDFVHRVVDQFCGIFLRKLICKLNLYPVILQIGHVLPNNFARPFSFRNLILEIVFKPDILQKDPGFN
jgi:hypothetical protein